MPSIDAVALYSEGKDHIVAIIVTITSSLDHLSITNLPIRMDLKAILRLCPAQDQEGLFWKRCQKLDLTRSFLDCSLKSGGATSAANAGVFPIHCSSATEDGVQNM